jgi:(1->4)-alpha-D-glucan 1-alpha-D-glucosylmutase
VHKLTIPNATYRLQFNRDLTFAQASQIIPYLRALGISHCYASPYLKARPGSTHGYDIVDHNALNPDIGDWDSFEGFVNTLEEHDMGHILDVVPNHMGIGGSDNSWWLDVLENGQSSEYAQYFDIDWRPVKEELRGKVLLPVLGDHYGKVLEDGELTLRFTAERGEFDVTFYDHRFPIDPSAYPRILSHGIEELESRFENADPFLAEFQSLITAFANLPPRLDATIERRTERLRDKEIHKRRLVELCRKSSVVADYIRSRVDTFNGVAGEPETFDLLHQLLEAQAYRLAYWQVAADEINYRRFFDINDLAGLRMENPEVFEATHRLIFKLVEDGKLDGLRIDHPDGLYDPLQYYRRLQRRLRIATGQERAVSAADEDEQPPFYVVVEKILASYEHLPRNWPVFGTTGYSFAYLANGLFVYPGSEHTLERLYFRFIRRTLDFDELLHERKKLIILVQLSSELTVLANLLNTIAQSERHTRDFTLNGLREALIEVVACFPVYRTYVTEKHVSEESRRFVQWAVAQAKKRSPATDISIFDFIHDMLLLEKLQGMDANYRRMVVHFAMRFQQYTSPVMAKALEDTTFYIHNRLTSLNDVGSNLRTYGVSPAAFHKANQDRVQNWPHEMIGTSTHDSKRSEDVRTRIDVISELPHEWQKHVARWSRIGRRKKRVVDQLSAPDRNDEYLLYQTLLGSYPLEDLDEGGLAAFRERIEGYMLKALKEAKVHTSWVNPNEEYEGSMLHFIRGMLGNLDRNPFLADFLPFKRRVAHFGMLNSLSQTLLKLTSPGVPDIYQGNELWQFDLVDPDNRHPVNYVHRHRLLDELRHLDDGDQPLASKVRVLLDTLEDGRAKLYVTWKALSLRQENPLLFRQGDYVGLTAENGKSDHIVAFARGRQGSMMITVVARWFATLLGDSQDHPLGQEVWGETWIEVPSAPEGASYVNIFTNETITTVQRNEKTFCAAAEVFGNLPVALLIARPA